MFCKNCGTTLADGASFCPSCGASVNQEQENTVCPNTFVDDQEKNSLATTILTLGIISISAGGLGMFVNSIFSIAALVLAIVCMKKVKTYRANYGDLEGKASTGNGLSIAGLILGILGVVGMILAILLFVAYFALIFFMYFLSFAMYM